jgi:hypothetical protein
VVVGVTVGVAVGVGVVSCVGVGVGVSALHSPSVKHGVEFNVQKLLGTLVKTSLTYMYVLGGGFPSVKQYDVDPEVVVEPVISTVNTPQGVYGKNTLLLKNGLVFPTALSKSD